MIICPENAKVNSEVDFWSKFPMEFLEKIFAEILQMQIKEFCNSFVIFSLKCCKLGKEKEISKLGGYTD